MDIVKRIGTTFLLGIMGIGFCIVLMTVGSYALKLAGTSNVVINWFTQNASVDISWLTSFGDTNNKYEKEYTFIEKYEYYTMNVEETIEEFCTGAFPKNYSYKMLADKYRENVLQISIGTELGDRTNFEYVEEAIGYVEDFSTYLDERDINFVYVQLPAGVRIQTLSNNEIYPSGKLELPDLFSEKMKQSEVDFIDINVHEDIIKTFSLDASGHWMPGDALKASAVITEEINDLLDWNFDCDLYDTGLYYNAMTLKIETEHTIKEEFDYNYELWIPVNSPNYHVEYFETQIFEGDFQNTLLTDISNWDRRSSTGNVIAYHDMWLINNSAFIEIDNLSDTNNSDKKILILGDSFSWPITSYLSQDVGEITVFHPRYFNGDVKKYIEYYQPDLVLWIYQEGQIGVDNDLNFGKVQ